MSEADEQTIPPDSDHWEIYFSFVDEKPAVILVDIGISEYAPIPKLTNLAWLWIQIRNPDEDGFPSEDEDMELNEVEDLVTEAMEGLSHRYVGRLTTDNRREFYFYTDDPQAFRKTAAGAMQGQSAYQYEIDDADDPEWTHYQTVLFPSAEDFQQIHNQKVIMQLRQEGDSLTEPRPIDHFANFKTEQDRETFAAAASDLGFEIVSRPELDENHEFPFSIGLLRVDAVDPETIDHVTFELFELAEEYHGEYDGWASPVVK